jgi:predicted metal-dependent hydrolase
MFCLFLILIILFISIYLIYYRLYTNDNLVYELATLDNNYYWVRENEDKSIAANTLAKIKVNMVELITYLKDNTELFPDYMSYIRDLVRRTKVINIMETPNDDKYTSYTINKGEKIVFCLRSKLVNTIHDMNTLMYVVIHEMAHVGCPEYGHTPLFRKIFKFLLVQSSKVNIYIPIDYRKKPQYYCGMTINEYLLD